MLMGIGGGALVSVTMFGIPLSTYIDQTRSVVSLSDFSMGVGKGLVFGIVVAAVGCLRGVQCGRSASAVGEAATSAVVSGIVAIILLDSLAAVICTVLHI
jgi:phospholipid/cholesterol/gamma-HCH transport system permease protein